MPHEVAVLSVAVQALFALCVLASAVYTAYYLTCAVHCRCFRRRLAPSTSDTCNLADTTVLVPTCGETGNIIRPCLRALSGSRRTGAVVVILDNAPQGYENIELPHECASLDYLYVRTPYEGSKARALNRILPTV